MHYLLRFAAATSLCACLVLAGCASRVPEAITNASILKSQPVQVSVKATTGEFSSIVKDEEYQKAITDSILATKVFTGISPDAKVTLQVELKTWERDQMGISMSGKSTALWTVNANGKIYTKSIEGNGTKQFGDAMMGENRSRLAAKAALEDGIKAGLEWIGTLDLKVTPASP